jgi:hypothetical protein
MATIEQTRVLATPTLQLNGRTLKIIPGSLKEEGGGLIKPRVVSAGGNAVELVNGNDLKEAMMMLKWEMANTAENQEIVREFHDDSNMGIRSTILISTETMQKPFREVVMVNKFSAEYSAEGNIPVETACLYNP